MKKKGLIISTVVMVVVLIASLTTATYAWFTSDGAAKVSGIELGAKSATSLQIGVDTKTEESFPNDLNGFYYGDDISYTAAWGGGIRGIGSVVNFASIDTLAGIEKAVSIAKDKISGAGAKGAVEIEAGNFYKANGNGTDYDLSSVAPASANVDYFDAIFGVVAVKPKLKQMYMTITVTATSTETIGMAAAIHFAFCIDGQIVNISTGKAAGVTKLSEENASVDAFDGLKYNNNYGIQGDGSIAENTTNKGTSKKDAGKGAVWTYVLEIEKSEGATFSAYDSNNADSLTAAAKHLVRVYAWIEGTDDSCINDTTGTGATIEIEFFGETEAKTIENGRISAGA